VLKTKRLGYELNQSPFYCLRSKKNLARLLYVSERQLKTIAQSEKFYRERDLKSTTGKTRHIEEPSIKLKLIQTRVKDILNKIKLPEYIYALSNGKSYIENACVHLNNHDIRSLDISTYFPSTRATHVYCFFHNIMKCSPDVASILSELLTLNNHLPTGSPSSPIISYFSHMDMWAAISDLVENANCSLSVYIDDVTISGNQVPERLIWEIKQQFNRHGLHSNSKKEKHYHNKKYCKVTGVIIKKGVELRLPNRQYVKINQVRHELSKLKTSSENKKDTIDLLRKKLQGLESQRQQIIDANDYTK
jgi:retron-type reverse transcriptase